MIFLPVALPQLIPIPGLPILATRPYLKRVTQLYPALNSIRDNRWFKLICGASYQDIPAIRNLTLAYALAGADCIDVAADPAIVAVALEAIATAHTLKPQTWEKHLGQPHQPHDPLLMVSLNDGEDPHFRKADFNPAHCPPECSRPCEAICPTQAISANPKRTQGVVDQKCYGCGRCIAVCPHQQIIARSHISTPQTIVPQLIGMGIQAIEIHTQVSHYTDFQRLWQVIQPYLPSLGLIAISCPDGDDYINYLKSLSALIHPLPCPLLWQVDGRPMSGDIGAGTTHATLKLAAKVLAAGLPGAVQLAGGTNAHTVPHLKTLGYGGTSPSHKLGLDPSPKPRVVGVAYGSYARVLLSPVLAALEAQAMAEPLSPALAAGVSPTPHLESYPDLLWQAVQLAHTLVSQLKPSVPGREESTYPIIKAQ